MARRRRDSEKISDFLSDIVDDIKDFLDDEIIDRSRGTERDLRRAGQTWTDSDDKVSRRSRQVDDSRDDSLDELREAVMALSKQVERLSSRVGVSSTLSNASPHSTAASAEKLHSDGDSGKTVDPSKKIYYDDIETVLDLLPRPYIAKRIQAFGGLLWLNVVDQRQAADTESAVVSDASQSTAVYIDTNDEASIRAVTQAVDLLNDALGYDGPQEVGIYRGSFFRRSLAAVKRGLTSKELRDRAIKAERALELKWIENLQAEVDNKQADAINKIVSSLDGIPEACIRCGSILLIKCIGSNGAPVLLTRTLSQLEIRTLEQYPEIQMKPRNVLNALATAVAANDEQVYQVPQIESEQ